MRCASCLRARLQSARRASVCHFVPFCRRAANKGLPVFAFLRSRSLSRLYAAEQASFT